MENNHIAKQDPIQDTVSILIVDDDQINCELLANILQHDGYLVSVASTGEEALQTVRVEPPNLIVLDIMMSGISGYDVCRQLKADSQTSEIPVIFVSALDDVKSKVKAFRAGGIDYIHKPFESEEVLARVRTHLALFF